MKKTIYILIFVAVIALGYFSFKFFSGRQSQQSDQVQSGLLPNSPTTSVPSGDYSIESRFPKTNTITIGTSQGVVEMKNFYKTFVDTEEGLVILKDTDEYEIAYDRENSSFLIYLKNPSSKDDRKNAEADFLNILGINQENACKLNVQESGSASSQFAAPSGEPRSPRGEAAGQGRGENSYLSFCLNKLQ